MPPLLSEPDTASDGDVPPLINNEDMEDVDDDDYDDDEDYDEDGPQEQVCLNSWALTAWLVTTVCVCLMKLGLVSIPA